MTESVSYKSAGVDIDVADATKRGMAKSLEPSDQRVLNRVGAFASLFEAKFPGVKDPVLVLKMEEPGSKQKLAFSLGREGGYVRSLCFDLVNHLINDIAVMGATPLAVQDAVICGKLESDVVGEIVQSIADACREQSCSLVGGETSEQPGVLEPGTYILAASIVGVVDRSSVIDGHTIGAGDVVLGVASNGLHTNGYSLVRMLLNKDSSLRDRDVEGERFIDVIMRPHVCYYQSLRAVTGGGEIHGLAHITGGGIEGNLSRVIPLGLCAEVDLSQIPVPKVFSTIKSEGAVSDANMLRTFNCGVGLVAVCAPTIVDRVVASFAEQGVQAFPMGAIISESSQGMPQSGAKTGTVKFMGNLSYS